VAESFCRIMRLYDLSFQKVPAVWLFYQFLDDYRTTSIKHPTNPANAATAPTTKIFTFFIFCSFLVEINCYDRLKPYSYELYLGRSSSFGPSS
jgi:hypothetical protein